MNKFIRFYAKTSKYFFIAFSSLFLIYISALGFGPLILPGLVLLLVSGFYYLVLSPLAGLVGLYQLWQIKKQKLSKIKLVSALLYMSIPMVWLFYTNSVDSIFHMIWIAPVHLLASWIYLKEDLTLPQVNIKNWTVRIKWKHKGLAPKSSNRTQSLLDNFPKFMSTFALAHLSSLFYFTILLFLNSLYLRSGTSQTLTFYNIIMKLFGSIVISLSAAFAAMNAFLIVSAFLLGPFIIVIAFRRRVSAFLIYSALFYTVFPILLVPFLFVNGIAYIIVLFLAIGSIQWIGSAIYLIVYHIFPKRSNF